MSTKPHKTGNGALMRRFLPYLIKYKGVLFFDLFCAALTTLCDIALPTIMRTLTNTVSTVSAAAAARWRRYGRWNPPANSRMWPAVPLTLSARRPPCFPNT